MEQLNDANQGMLNQYRRDKVYTATAEQLTLMLYEAALANIRQCRVAIGRGDPNLLTRSRKGRDILVALAETVNLSHEFGPKMKDLYLYCWRTYFDAVMKKDASPLDSVEEVLQNLSQGLIAFHENSGVKKASPEEHLSVNFSG